MNNDDRNAINQTCPICGGLLGVDYTIRFSQCQPSWIQMAIADEYIRLCPGHPHQNDPEGTPLQVTNQLYNQAVEVRQKLFVLAQMIDPNEYWDQAFQQSRQLLLTIQVLREKLPLTYEKEEEPS